MASSTDYFADDQRTNRERMLAGDLYIADDPESGRRAQRAVQLADAYLQAAITDEGAARSILAELLGSLEEGAFVKPPLYVDYGEHMPIAMGDSVWLGGGVIVCPGVTIGDNSVIGAGAVVTRDIPANVVAVGNPARVLRGI